MKTINTTQEQEQSIRNYRRMGIDIELIDNDSVKITQSRLLNGYILNNKQLYDRANEIFPEKHILPVVYSLQVDDIDLNWIELKMDEFGIKRRDLIKQLAIDKSSLSLILSGHRELSKPMRATFFYYFLTYELNRDLREQLNVPSQSYSEYDLKKAYLAGSDKSTWSKIPLTGVVSGSDFTMEPVFENWYKNQFNVSNETEKWDNEKIADWLIDVRLLIEGQRKEAISQLEYLIKELKNSSNEKEDHAEWKYKLGDKVVPHSWKRERDGYQSVPLIRSYSWRKALEMNQPYLYVSGYKGDSDFPMYMLSHKPKEDGDFFYETDLIPYKE